MDFLLRMETTVDLPKELSRRIWLLEGLFNARLEKRRFQSPRQKYGLWVSAKPPPPEWFQGPARRAEVKLDRRDGAIRTVVIGDFDRYKAASLSEGVDLFVIDAERAIRQAPAKYLLPEEAEILVAELALARRAYHEAHTGHVPELAREEASPSVGQAAAGDESAPDQQQIVVQWLESDFAPDANAQTGGPESDLLTEIEDLLEARSDGLYYVDGHDCGSGTVNIFLYAVEADAAISRLILLADQGALPRSMRIGLPFRSRLRAVYPPGLDEFDFFE